MSSSALPTLAFTTPKAWETWLHENHSKVDGIWMKFAKKGSGVITINHDQALLVALCYGWIDGQGKPLDETYWLMKMTPRRARSMWSKRNCDFVEQLIKEGKMQPAGFSQIEAAKVDGRWEAAYDSPKNMVVPEDFLKELAKDPQALEFFNTLNKTNTYAIAWRLQTAKKPETRERRKQVLLTMLKNHKKLH